MHGPDTYSKLDPSARKYLTFIGSPVSPEAKKHPLSQRRAAAANALATPTAPTNTEIAPFFGNLTVVHPAADGGRG